MTQFILPSAFVSVTIVIPRKAFTTYITPWVCSPTKLCRQLKVISDRNLETFGEEFWSHWPLASRGKSILSVTFAFLSRSRLLLRKFVFSNEKTLGHWYPYKEIPEHLYKENINFTKKNKGLGRVPDVLRDEWTFRTSRLGSWFHLVLFKTTRVCCSLLHRQQWIHSTNLPWCFK